MYICNIYVYIYVHVHLYIYVTYCSTGAPNQGAACVFLMLGENPQADWQMRTCVYCSHYRGAHRRRHVGVREAVPPLF